MKLNYGFSVSKLSTKVLRKSKGAKTRKGDTLLVWYEGSLEDGTVFDGNYDFNSFTSALPPYFQNDQGFLVQPRQPFEFKLGAKTVIEGWDKGLTGRRLGEVIQLQIPSKLAYGESGAGSIPPGADLTFKVEVLALLQDKQDAVAKFPSLANIGINTRKLGLTDGDLTGLSEVIIGMNTSDRIIGSNGRDLIAGLSGNDRLFGAGGGDLLIGGKGKNRYIYTDVSDSFDSDGERDQIVDFGKKDRINLRPLLDKGDLSFIDAATFSGSAGEVRFKKEMLEVDLDGDKSADLAVLLPGTSALKASHLIL